LKDKTETVYVGTYITPAQQKMLKAASASYEVSSSRIVRLALDAWFDANGIDISKAEEFERVKLGISGGKKV
jgi:hypothetical protein